LLSRTTCTNYRSLIGGIAQLVERLVRNEKVRGSNPLTSISLITKDLQKIESQLTTPAYNMCQSVRIGSKSMNWVNRNPL
jgi:hypothetical protein